MDTIPSASVPAVTYALASLAAAVVLLVALWTYVTRKATTGLPVVLSCLLAVVYTLFPDAKTLVVSWDVLIKVLINVIATYGAATLAGTLVGDAMQRKQGAQPEREPVEGEDEEVHRRPRPPWLLAFRASWYRPGPVNLPG